MNQHRLYSWPLNVEPTYNLKATFSTKESMLRWLYFRESVHTSLVPKRWIWFSFTLAFSQIVTHSYNLEITLQFKATISAFHVTRMHLPVTQSYQWCWSESRQLHSVYPEFTSLWILMTYDTDRDLIKCFPSSLEPLPCGLEPLTTLTGISLNIFQVALSHFPVAWSHLRHWQESH